MVVCKIVIIGTGVAVAVGGMGVMEAPAIGDGVIGVGVKVAVLGTRVNVGIAIGVAATEHAESAPIISIRAQDIKTLMVVNDMTNIPLFLG
jgi:hypothetical protein